MTEHMKPTSALDRSEVRFEQLTECRDWRIAMRYSLNQFAEPKSAEPREASHAGLDEFSASGSRVSGAAVGLLVRLRQ
jgi:hypothetical protein